MIDTLLSIIAPHHCCICGKNGTLLCSNCKYDISFESYERCLGCGKPTGTRGVCRNCRLPYNQAWCVGERRDGLEKLINAYKFERVKGAYTVLADLLLERLPELPNETVIVPVPTVASHIRQRGYDHAFLLAREVAKKRGLRLDRHLVRLTNTTQRGAHSVARLKQAQEAFGVSGTISLDGPYLIIDDVITTGATVMYAARHLKEAGATDVWVAAIARNPLD